MELPLSVYMELLGEYSPRLSGLTPEQKISAPCLWDGTGGGDGLFVCVSPLDRPPDDGRTVLCREGQAPETRRRTVFLASGAPMAAIYNLLAREERRLSVWDSRLSEAVGRDAQLQELIDISEPVLREPILVSDPSFKLLAYTKNTGSADGFFTELTTRGYPSLDTWRRMGAANYYSREHYTGRLTKLCTDTDPPLDVVLKAVRLGGHLAATGFMLFENRPYTDGARGLFALLMARVEQLLARAHADDEDRRRHYEYLLADLIENPRVTAEEAASRMKYARYPALSGYRALKILPGDGNVKYLYRVFCDENPELSPIIYKDAILATVPSSAGEEIHRRLEGFLAAGGALGGLSNRRESMVELGRAWAQAGEALELGRAFREKASWRSLLAQGESRLYEYRDYAVYALIRAHAGREPVSEVCDGALLTLRGLDRADGGERLLTLYYYLSSGQSYTEAAKRLFVHRNSVIYRLDKIKEAAGLGEITPEAAQRLLFSYRVLDVMDIFPQE